MSDHHRGAYTPSPEVPLEFDPRSPTASRRPLPLGLIACAALVLTLLAALALVYSRGVRGDNESPRPVGEPIGQLKTAPAAAAQPQDASGDVDVSAPQNVPDRAPAFAAAPELPRPRPAPRLRVVPVAPAELAAAPPPAVRPIAAPPPPAPDYPATRQNALARTSLADASPLGPGLPAAPTQVRSAPPPAALSLPAPPAQTASTEAPPLGGVRVQIGAFSSEGLADKGWSDVAALVPQAIGGKTKHVERVEKEGQTLYRTSVGGFADRASADAFCDSLKAKGKICFVKS